MPPPIEEKKINILPAAGRTTSAKKGREKKEEGVRVGG